MSRGILEFLGRSDQQVKIRGFRVELAEVELTLARHPAVREAILLAREDGSGDRQLVAYVVAEDTSPETLRNFLSERLPDYMIPSAFVFLKSLPLSTNGKIARDKLPVPGPGRPELSEEFVGPRDPTEARLARIWSRLLQSESVGVKDDFFNLGGHSLLGVRLFAEIEKQFATRLPLAALFQARTVEQLAALLREPGIRRHGAP